MPALMTKTITGLARGGMHAASQLLVIHVSCFISHLAIQIPVLFPIYILLATLNWIYFLRETVGGPPYHLASASVPSTI